VFVAGRPRREVLDVLQLNSRTPRLNLACLSSLAGAALGLAAAMRPLASELGALADDAEQRAGAVLGRVERGQGKADIRQPSGPVLALRLCIASRGSRLEVSFPDLPEATQTPLNATRAMTLDSVIAGISATLRIDPHVATALARLIDMDLRDESLLSARRRRPAGWGRALTGRAVYQATCDALGASCEAEWPERDPHFDSSTGRLGEARRNHLETLERGK
jgi:N-methylhydantoinase B/oxoprolinase/acetone carboxylase alpha subunit